MRLLAALLLLGGFAAPAPAGDDKPDFNKDVYPVLKKHCIACHTHNVAKGELRLDTAELILKGGENGAAVVKGDSKKSLLYQAITGEGDVLMPPKKNKVGATPLKPEEIALLQRWIDSGAAPSAVPLVLNTEPIPWQPLPPGLNPINSVAISPEGLYAACGRANQIFIYTIPAGGATPARLLDAALPAAADRDLILSMAFSPDGRQFASGGYRCLRLWRRTESAPALTLDSATTAAASADEKWIATAGPDFGISIWETGTGKRARDLKGHTAAVRSLAFSPDGASLCSGSADKTVRVWSMADGQSTQAEVSAEINAVVWVADGKRIAAGGSDNLLRIWTLPFDKPKELKGHGGPVTSLSAATGGKRLLSGGEDGTVRVWDTDSGKEIRKVDLGAPVAAVATAGDGKRWAAAGGTSAKVWKENGELLATMKGDRVTIDAQGDAERSLAFVKDQIAYYKTALQEHEKALATETDSAKKAAARVEAASKEAVQKREALKKAEAAKAETGAKFAAVAEPLKKLAGAKEAAEKALAEISKGVKPAAERVAQAKAAKGDDAKAALDQALAAQSELAAAVKKAEELKTAAAKAHADFAESQKDVDAKAKAAEKAFTDAQQAAQQADQAKSAAEQNDERLVQVQKKGEELVATTKKQQAAAETDQKTAEAGVEAAKKAVADAEKPVRALAFSADGQVLATSGDDRILHLWNVETGRGGEQHRGLEAAPSALAFLGGRKLMAVVGAKTLLWSGHSSWTLERTIGNGGIDSPIMDRVLALAYSPDGKSLAAGGGIAARAGELKIWNPADGKLIREIKDAHSDTVFGVAWSRDGAMLASGGADKLVKLWDPASGRLVKLFEGHTQHVLSVSWKRNGRTVVSSGADRVAKIWDLVTGEQLKSIEGFRKEVTVAAYLEGSNEILLACGDGQLRTAKEDGNKVRGFQAGKDYIESAAASLDGKLIVAGGSDSVLRVFESSKDKILASYDPP